MAGSERADPAAEETSQNKGENKSYGRKKEGKEYRTGSDECAQCQQGIKMEKDLDMPYIIPTGKAGLEQEKQEKREETGLTEDAEGLDGTVLFRSFFSQWSTAPG